MKVKFQIDSKSMVQTLRRLPRQMTDATAVGQFNAAQKTMVLAKSRAPFEEGDLESKAFVDDVRYTAHGAAVDFGFEGPDYLIRQHEDLDYNHPGIYSKTSDPGRAAQGQPKFLESAMNDTERQTRQIIAKAVADFLRTGVLPKVEDEGIPSR